MKPCPCGSQLSFIKCCKPFITGKAYPKTAEQLMRSRYSAYTRANIDYIIATQQAKAAENFDPIAAKNWAQSAKWLGLKVLNIESGQASDQTGMVEFIARYRLGQKLHTLHEKSLFEQHQERWFYTDKG